jgi:broad specificity phosphatase PhoE
MMREDTVVIWYHSTTMRILLRPTAIFALLMRFTHCGSFHVPLHIGAFSQQTGLARATSRRAVHRSMTGANTTAAMDMATTTTATVDIYPYRTNPQDLLKKSYKMTKIVHFIRHAEGTHNIDKNYRCITNLDARLTNLGMAQSRALADRIRARAQAAAAASDSNNKDDDDDKVCCPLADLYANADLVVTSPLTRCVQTALLSLEPILSPSSSSSATRKNPPPPVIAHEAVRETVNFNCDRRRMIHEIVQDFSVLPENKQEAKDDADTENGPLPSFSFSIDFHSQITTPHDDLWEHYEKWLGSHEEYQHHRESSQIYKVADRARFFFSWLATRPEKHVVVCSHQAYLRALWNFGQPGRVGTDLPQILDDRRSVTTNLVKDVPVVRFCGGTGTISSTSIDNAIDEFFDAAFAESLMKDYDNCEIRSVRVAWPMA